MKTQVLFPKRMSDFFLHTAITIFSVLVCVVLNTSSAGAQTYCQPGATTCEMAYSPAGFISNVTITPQGPGAGAPLVNSTGTSCGKDINGYSNYSNVGTPAYATPIGTTVTAGNSLHISVNRFYNIYITSNVQVYIDLNNDGDFIDADEIIFSAGNAAENISGYSINISANTTAGTKRIRIRNFFSNNTPNNPCSGIDYGETEDYNITVLANCTPPTTNASGFSATPDFSSINASWTRGNGDAGVIVVARLAATPAVAPANGNDAYTDNPIFGNGSATGAGNYVVYKGTGTNVNVTNLSLNTNYHFDIYEYNTASVCYKLPGYTNNAVTTLNCTPPSPQTSNGNAANPTNTTIDFSWSRGGGNKVIVLARQGGVNATPVSGNTYTDFAAFGSGTQIGSGNYVVYIGTGTSVTVTGLLPNLSYGFAAYEFNDGPPKCYNTTSPASGTLSTTNTMSFISSTTTQNNADVNRNATNQWIVGLQVVTAGATTPMSVSSITFNTTGTTNAANDIANARIYYTGTTNSFSAINPFGSVIASPNGTHAVTGTQTLSSGTNYFWLTYDIKSGAIANNYAKAAVTQVVVNGIGGQNGGTKTPSNTSTASRMITLTYCAPWASYCADDYTNNGVITNVNVIGNTTNINNNSAGCGTINRGFSDFTALAAADVTAGNTYAFSITRDSWYQNRSYYLFIWIDINNDGAFANSDYHPVNNPSGERFYQSGASVSVSVSGNITIPTSTTPGIHRIRFRNIYSANPAIQLTPCATLDYFGEAEDYKLDVGSSCTPPTVQASSFNASVGGSGLDLTWARGDGDNVIIIARQGSAVNSLPVNGTSYTDNPAFGSGQQIGSGNYVVYAGSGTAVTVTGLTPLQTYHFAILEYNNTGVCYLSPAVTGNGTYCSQPGTQAKNFSSSAAANKQFTISWERGSGNNVLVVARSGSAVNAIPASGTNYTDNSVFASGDQIGTGNYVVYNGAGTSVTVTGLSLNTTYHFALFEYDNGGPCYKTPAHTGTAVTTNVMTYLSATTTQNNADVARGSNDEMLVGLQVVTEGATSPISVTSISFNTNGSTYPAQDIANARIYYTGTSSTFAANGQFGPTTVGPNGSYMLPGTQALSAGTNYFWLAYDIKPGAALMNYAKGAVTSLEMDLGVGAKTPSNTSTASRRISIIYCTPPTAGYYWNGSQYNGMITNVKITDVAASQIVFDNSAPNRVNAPVPGYDDQTSVTPPSLIPGREYKFDITRSIDGSSNYPTQVYVDYHDDGTFGTSAPDLVYNSGDTGPGTPTRTFNYTIPLSGINTGIHRLRIRNRNTNLPLYVTPCDGTTDILGVSLYGETEDYFVNICTLPEITVQPTAQTVCEQERATLSVTVSELVGSTFQWYKDDNLLPGMNGTAISGIASLSDAGDYKCVISNGCGSVTSNEVHLTVKVRPVVNVSPVSAVCTGTATSTLTASGVPNYTWAPNLYIISTNGVNNVPITVETSQLTFYTVTGTAVNGCTANRIVPVATVPVGGTSQPAYSIVCSGNSQNLSVINVAGNSYQWQSSPDGTAWSDISGATNDTYTASPVANTYYRLMAKSNACWNVASTTAEVDISSQPITVTVTRSTDNAITLDWTPIGGGNYNINYQGPNSGSASNVTPPYTITGLVSNSSYNITVTQTGLPLVSCPASGVVTGATTLCSMPTGVTVSSPANKQLKVDWNGDAGNYRVYYREVVINGSYLYKDVTTTGNSGTTTISVMYGGTYEVYVVRKNCPSPGVFGQKSALAHISVKPLSACTPAPTIIEVKSTCPGQIEVSMSGSPTGKYTVFIQRLTPTVASGYKYSVTGGTFQIHVGQPGQTFAVGVASKCVSGTSDMVMYPGGITIKPLCNPIGNLVLSNATCNGFTASWNREVCSENQVSTYQLFMKKTGALTWSSYSVNSPNAPISPYLKVNWLGKGYEMSCYVKGNYICNGYVIGGPASITQVITTLSAGCREEEDNVLEPETPSTQIISADNSEAISIYPNPNNGQFTLDISRLSNDAVQVKTEVMNVLGQTVLTNISETNSGHGNEIITLPASVSAGIYFVRVTVGDNTYTAKVDIMK